MEIHILAKILGVNLRRNFLPHFITAVLILTAASLLMGISALNRIQSARPVEQIMPLVGMILLTPVFYPEQNENIRDTVNSKKTDHIRVCIIRTIYSVFFLALLCGGFIFAMYLCESAVTVRHFIGGFASGLFLGAVGFFFAGISKNIIAGYMAALIYYTANSVAGRRVVFDLFTMTAAIDFDGGYIILIKYLLIAAAVLIMILCFIFMKAKVLT